jgi:glycosyltransferase involved in cell wall biosynthesis
MRILYVYDGNWPQGATRVAKQTRSLARAGHDVHLVSRNELRGPRIEHLEWMTVHRLPSFIPRWLNRGMNFPYFFNPVWMSVIHKTGVRCQADCIIVADLPLAPTAIWAGQKLGVPVHYDMAEVYPEFLRGLWGFDEMSWSDHLVRNPTIAEWLERFVLKRVASTFVVSDESLRRCLALGVPADRLVLVGNTPEAPEQLYEPAMRPQEFEVLNGRRILLFVGILIGDRGVARAIEAMSFLRNDIPDAVLVIIGDGPERPRLEQQVRDLELEDSVVLLGWKEHGSLARYYTHADVGLLPFLDGSHVRITLANKLFDYMGAGLPVIASDLPPMRRIVEECKSGILAPAGNAAALAASIREILLDEGQRRTMGLSGRNAVLSKYRWSVDEQRMLLALDPAESSTEELSHA